MGRKAAPVLSPAHREKAPPASRGAYQSKCSPLNINRVTKPTCATLRRSLPVAWSTAIDEERRTLRG